MKKYSKIIFYFALSSTIFTCVSCGPTHDRSNKFHIQDVDGYGKEAHGMMMYCESHPNNVGWNQDIAVIFRIDNLSDVPQEYCPDTISDCFSCEAFDEEGTHVHSTGFFGYGGSNFGSVKIPPKGGIQFAVKINKWCDFIKPGKYTIYAKYETAYDNADGSPIYIKSKPFTIVLK